MVLNGYLREFKYVLRDANHDILLLNSRSFNIAGMHLDHQKKNMSYLFFTKEISCMKYFYEVDI